MINRIYKQRNPKYEIVLTEENSGMTDHIFHGKLTDDVYEAWTDILKHLDQNKKIGEYLNVEWNNLIEISLDTLTRFTNIKTEFLREYTLNCLVLISKKKINNVFRRAEFSMDKERKMTGYMVLEINPEMTIKFILQQKTEIRSLAEHEVSHFIKFLHQNYQNDVQHFDTQKNRREYLTYKHELESNIPSINSELKTIKSKYPDMTYSEAIHMSKTYREYEKFVFDYDYEAYKKITSKTSYYWRNELGGKMK